MLLEPNGLYFQSKNFSDLYINLIFLFFPHISFGTQRDEKPTPNYTISYYMAFSSEKYDHCYSLEFSENHISVSPNYFSSFSTYSSIQPATQMKSTALIVNTQNATSPIYNGTVTLLFSMNPIKNYVFYKYPTILEFLSS